MAGTPAARLEEGHDFLATGGAFFPDDRHVVTSAGDGTVRIWDRTTGGQTRRIAGTGTLGALALSDDGKWLVTGSDTTDAQLRAPMTRVLLRCGSPGTTAILPRRRLRPAVMPNGCGLLRATCSAT